MCKKLAALLSAALLGAAVVLILVFVFYLNQKPDLAPWHTVELANEFRADRGIRTLEEYLKLESKLFQELRKRVIDPLPGEFQSGLNRYTAGSLSDPGRWPVNWNRTFEHRTEEPRLGVLMLHGLSDSPYSLRQLADDLHHAGAWVVGLRVPGHGTVPAGLSEIRWQDMAAAVNLAMVYLKSQLDYKPLIIVGYSNGAALAIEYTLNAIQGNTPPPDRLVLISPAIGITPFAALAVWQSRLGSLLGLEKLQWADVIPEYDPYKYQSFAINAGDLEHQLTIRIQDTIRRLSESEKLNVFPPTLAFLSVADATVSTRAVVDGLYTHLPSNQHELVVFDINHKEHMNHLFTANPTSALNELLDNEQLTFTFTVISNRRTRSAQVAEISNREDSGVANRPLTMSWPDNVYSLSHVALPIPPNDPLYGGPNAESGPGLSIGDVALRGEKGLLLVSATDQLRQRWNPFYSYMEGKTKRFIFNEQ